MAKRKCTCSGCPDCHGGGSDCGRMTTDRGGSRCGACSIGDGGSSGSSDDGIGGVGLGGLL